MASQNNQDGDFSSELYNVVVNDDRERLKNMLDRGQHVNKFLNDYGGKSILHISCEKGRLECTQILLDNGANAVMRDEWGMTPLLYCMITQYTEIAEVILERCPDSVWSRDIYGKTPMHCAVESGNLESVDLLLQNGADVDYANDNGETPLMATCKLRVNEIPQENQIDIVKRLLHNGADVNLKDLGDKRTALQWACVKKNVSIVETLLSFGPDTNSLDAGGRTCLTTMMVYNVRITDRRRDIDDDVMAVVVLLTQSGINLDLNKCENSNPLAVACLLKADVLVRFFLDLGANPDVSFVSQVTPLLIAASRQDVPCARALLEYNCRLDTKGRVRLKGQEEHTWDPMQLAIHLGCWEIVLLMSSVGYNLSKFEYFATPEIDEETPQSLIKNPAMFYLLQDISCNAKTLFDLVTMTIWRAIKRDINENVKKLGLPTRIVSMISTDKVMTS